MLAVSLPSCFRVDEKFSLEEFEVFRLEGDDLKCLTGESKRRPPTTGANNKLKTNNMKRDKMDGREDGENNIYIKRIIINNNNKYKNK